jgi:hypothetical protein
MVAKRPALQLVWVCGLAIRMRRSEGGLCALVRLEPSELLSLSPRQTCVPPAASSDCVRQELRCA